MHVMLIPAVNCSSSKWSPWYLVSWATIGKCKRNHTNTIIYPKTREVLRAKKSPPHAGSSRCSQILFLPDLVLIRLAGHLFFFSALGSTKHIHSSASGLLLYKLNKTLQINNTLIVSTWTWSTKQTTNETIIVFENWWSVTFRSWWPISMQCSKYHNIVRTVTVSTLSKSE